jgi:hypothetical protein
MARFDSSLIGSDFAVGSTYYLDHYPGDEINRRIVLNVTFDRAETIPMILDTGSAWCILDPQLVEAWHSTFEEIYHSSEPYNIRGHKYTARYVRARITLTASNGRDLSIEATFFVPDLPPGETWNKPNFLGLFGFLERLRFGVDAAENAFYFGSDAS